MKKKAAVGLFVGGAAVVLAAFGMIRMTGAQSGTETVQTEEQAVAVAAGVPERGAMAVSGTYVGTVSPQEQVSVIPLVTGEVTEANYEVGDYVEAGSVLVRIDDEAARLQVESARLTKEGAELSAQRTLGSAQVMSNLSMENSINGIQFQIDQAKKQYETAGSSVTDAEEAKEDMKDALDKINSSISDMESGYSGMKSMAASAKKLVRQNENGVWEWIFDPYKEPDWENEYETEPPTGDTGDGSSDTGNVPEPTTPPESAGTPDTPDTPGTGGADGDNSGEGTSGTDDLDTNNPDAGEEGSDSAASDGSNQESDGTDASESQEGTGDSQTPSGPPDESSAGSSAGGEDDPEGNKDTPADEPGGGEPAGNEPVGDEPAGAGNDTAGSSQTGASGSAPEASSGAQPSEAPDAAAHALAFGRGKQESAVRLTMQEIRSHKRPGQETDAEKLTMQEAAGQYEVIAVTNTGNTDDTEQKKKPYTQYQTDYAAYHAIRKLIDAGYSPADIGEGRMDSSVSGYATQIASLKSQAATLESNLKSMDSNIESAETARSTTKDTIDYYEDNLKNAQTQYGIQTGQAYQDTAAALANQIAASDLSIASAQMQLENYVLSAPISGTIEQKNVDDFGMVSAGNPVYVISNKDSMTVTFYVSEAVKNQLYPGQTVMLERSGNTYNAAVTQVGQSVDAKTSLFEVKAAVEGSDLANGVTVKITADTHRTENALLIPYDAVYYESEKAYVYCVAEDGTAVKTEVQTGIYNEDQIEITDGLTEDSLVIRSWSPQLADGVKVRVVEEEAAE